MNQQGVAPIASRHTGGENGAGSGNDAPPQENLDLTIDDAIARIDSLLQAGQVKAAEALCSTIGLQCAPAVYAAGVLALSRREFDRAADLFSAATHLAPMVAEFHLCHARALLERQRPDECAAAARRALALEPSALGHKLLASAYSRMWSESQAAEEFAKALELSPGEAPLWSSLGIARLRSDDLEGAMAALRAAVDLDPNFVDGWLNLARAFAHHGATDEAVSLMRRARDLAPDSPDLNSSLLFELNELPSAMPDEVFGEHRRWGKRLIELVGSSITNHATDPDPDRRLRIGYVSGDFRRHPVAFFSAAMLTLYDRTRFEVACYFNGLYPDQTSWQIRSGVDRWVDIAGLTDDAVAALIREDRVDILVDLSGHTAGNRLSVFARRPAPIQVTYLGYVNTTGLAAIDYRIADRWTDPPGESEHLYTERLLRPFASHVCYAPAAGSPDVTDPPVKRNGYMTFGSFNRARKINSVVAELWSRVLRAVPGSRLVLRPGPSCKAPLLERFAAHGVADRVDIDDRRGTMNEYLAAYAEVDLVLDAFPWNGITTSCDALWMGVPLLTLEGREHRSRAGVSLLQNLRLPQLIARDQDDFVARAVALSADVEELGRLRLGLRDRMLASPVMDGAGFTRALEETYRAIWQQFCEERATSGRRSLRAEPVEGDAVGSQGLATGCA
jgi:protein O-GlcNAc transferase